MKEKILGVVIIVCVICLIGLLILKNSNDSKMPESIDGRTAEGQLLLSGIGTFSEKYTGYYKTKQITEKLEKITKESIPNLYKDIRNMNDQKLEKYYNENSLNIKEQFGKTNIEEFKEFSKKIQSLDVNLNNWYSLNIDKNTFVDKSDKKNYAYAEYTVSYNKDEKIIFSIYIAQTQSKIPAFIIDIK